MSMDAIKNLLKSRTVWTFIGLFVFNGLTSVQSMVPENYVGLVNLVLSLLGIYFRAIPKAQM